MEEATRRISEINALVLRMREGEDIDELACQLAEKWDAEEQMGSVASSLANTCAGRAEEALADALDKDLQAKGLRSPPVEHPPVHTETIPLCAHKQPGPYAPHSPDGPSPGIRRPTPSLTKENGSESPPIDGGSALSAPP